MRLALLVLVCAGCGRVNFDPTSGSDADADADSAPPDARCTLGPFSAPSRLAGQVNHVGADDWAPTITGDGLAIYFYSVLSSTPGAPDIWRATRLTPAAPWGAATVVAEISAVENDTFPFVTADDLTIYLASRRPGGQGVTEMYVATRTDRGAPFAAPVLVPELNSAGDELGVTVSADQRDAVVCSTRSGQAALYAFHRETATVPFGPPVPLAELDTLETEQSPALSADGLTLLYTSDRPGGVGQYDVWMAERPAVDAPFSAPVNVTELNSPLDEYGLSLSVDGTTLYLGYMAQMAGGPIDVDLWSSSRTRSCR